MKHILSILILSGCTSFATAQTASDTLFAAWYNVENLFDPFDSPNAYNQPEGNGDDEYIPGSKSDWTMERYQAKLKNLAQVINGMNNGRGPDIIGVCEVENQNVLWDLINGYLVNKNYSLVYKESQDGRSIDIAILYRNDKLKWDWMKAFNVSMEGKRPTRDIIFAKFISGDKPLFVGINHWPSKSGGAEASESYRERAAERTLEGVNEILATDKNADILLMGDFNCNPDEKPLQTILGARSAAEFGKEKSQLWNLTWPVWNPETTGTLQYKGKWDIIDNFIASNGLFDKTGFRFLDGSVSILNYPELREKEGKYAGSPFRTYAGSKYLGGFSDHFSITVKLVAGGK